MKLNIYYLLFLVNFNSFIYSQDDIKVLDKIIAIIYHPQGHELILNSDLISDLDKVEITREEAIFRKLVEIDAQMLQITSDDEDVDRYIAKVQKEHKLTQEELIQELKPLTLEQYKKRLKVHMTIQNTLDRRVRVKVNIEKDDIENYYKNNPIYTEKSYIIQQASVNIESGSKALKKIKLERAIESNEIDKLVNWSESIEIKESEIAQDKAHIKKLNLGSVVIFENDKSLNLIKLISKNESRILELKERESEIYGLLYQEKYDKLFQEYKAKLFGQYELEEDNSISKNPKIAIIKYID